MRALIIAVGDYAEGTGYSDLNAANDVPLVRGGLLLQGFDSTAIQVVRDGDATRDGILRAIRTHLLEPAVAGDVIFIHYSGHGHRITDDNGDEMDGLDEVLVPHDAPNRTDGSYDGSLHLRDDELGEVIEELRRRVGPDGNVVLSLDACHSGSATRGFYELPVRGVLEPLGPPAVGASGEDVAGGFAEESTTRGGGADETGLAPYVVLSAARHDELSREVWSDEGMPVGSLSYALGRALALAAPGHSYRQLFDGIEREMARLVPMQTPQVEGDQDVELFSGRAVAQAPYVEVLRVAEDTLAQLDGGMLIGLLPGTLLALHAAGTRDPGVSEVLAEAEVLTASATRATVRLDRAIMGLAGAWAFVTRPSFGSLAVRIVVEDAVDGDIARTLRERFADGGVVTVVEDTPDLVVSSREGGVVVVSAADDRVVAGPFEASGAGAAERVAVAVRSFARNRYVSRIELEDAEVEVRLEVVPAEHEIDPFEGCLTSSPRPEATARGEGGEWRFEDGDGYLLRIVNTGGRGAYVTILSLGPNGSITQLFPHEAQSAEDNFLEAGASYEIDLCYRARPPYGLELLKLFATREPVNFGPILRGEGAARSAAELNPLERLLADAYSGTRSDVTAPPRGSGSTFTVPIRVVPAAGSGG